jgi:hypothetical protein
MTDNEKFYDEQIAPELLKLRELCAARGMAFVASVEYNIGDRGRTEFQPPDEGDKLSAAQRLAHWAARCNGNVDILIGWIVDHGKKHGHNSIYITQLIAHAKQYERAS